MQHVGLTSNCKRFSQWNYLDAFKQPIRKREKLLTMTFTLHVYRVFSPHLFPAFDHFGGFVIVKKQIDVSFFMPSSHWSFRHNIVKVKFAVEPRAAGRWTTFSEGLAISFDNCGHKIHLLCLINISNRPVSFTFVLYQTNLILANQHTGTEFVPVRAGLKRVLFCYTLSTD